MKVINATILLTLCASSGLWYASSPAQQKIAETWVREFNPPSTTGLVSAAALTADKAGSVYIAGLKADSVSIPSRIIYDYVTIKYDGDGRQQWASIFAGPGASNDRIEAIAVDDAGNVYVTGESEAPDETTSCVTIKYNSSGAQQWVASFSGSVSSAKDIALDNQGNVYVTGKSRSSGLAPMSECLTIKYDANGNERWVARFGGGSSPLDEAWAIAVDTAGGVYVTGGSSGADSSVDYTTIKYSADGKQQWVARYNGPGAGLDIATSIALDSSSNVYVTGLSASADSSTDIATIKYNSDGVEQWARRYNGVKNANDTAKDLTVDAAGNVYVTGVCNSRGGSTGSEVNDPSRDYVTLKYSSAGDQQWAAVYDGPGRGADEALALSLDGSGNIYVTGRSVGEDSSFDYATVKYNSAGGEQWVARYAGSNNWYDGATDVAVDGRGGVYVAGSSQIDASGKARIVTIKYAGEAAPSVPLANLSAASYSASALAAEAIVAAFGSNLAITSQAAVSITLPTTLGGTKVEVKDSAGQVRLAPLYFVSPFQVNYQIPAGTAVGTAEVTVTSGAGIVSKATISVKTIGPAIFTADLSGGGLAAALALRVRADGSQTYEPAIRFDIAQNKFVAEPIDLGPDTDQVYLILFCTGVRSRSSIAAATASLGGQAGQVSYVGSQLQFPGLDQVNVLLPRSLIGRGELDCALSIDGQPANVVKFHVR